MEKLKKSWLGRPAQFALLVLIVAFLLGQWTGHSTSAPDPAALKVQGADTIGNAVQVFTTPPGAGGITVTELSGSQAGANAGISATLLNAANQTTYITGFQITGGGATAGSIITPTITGTVANVPQYRFAVPAGATVGATPLVVTFNPPLAASAPNTAISVSVPAFGAGNTDAAVSAQGFRQ